MSDRKHYMVEFEEFWHDIVLDSHGDVDLDALARELYDYRTVLRSFPIVLCHATLGMLSKPNTDPHAACSVIDERQEAHYREALADDLEERAEEEARGSRDFGRGYMHAVKVLRG